MNVHVLPQLQFPCHRVKSVVVYAAEENKDFQLNSTIQVL